MTDVISTNNTNTFNNNAIEFNPKSVLNDIEDFFNADKRDFHFQSILEESPNDPQEMHDYMQELEIWFEKIQANYVELESKRRFYDLLLTCQNEEDFQNLALNEEKNQEATLETVEQEALERRKLIEQNCAQLEQLATEIEDKSKKLENTKKQLKLAREQILEKLEHVERLEKRVFELQLMNSQKTNKDVKEKIDICCSVLGDVTQIALKETENMVECKSTNSKLPWCLTITSDDSGDKICQIVDFPLDCEDVKKLALVNLTDAIAELNYRGEMHMRRMAECDELADKGICKSVLFTNNTCKIKLAARHFVTLEFEKHYDGTAPVAMWFVSASPKKIENQSTQLLNEHQEWTISGFLDALTNKHED